MTENENFINLPPFKEKKEEKNAQSDSSALIWDSSASKSCAGSAIPTSLPPAQSENLENQILSFEEIKDLRILLSHFSATIKNVRQICREQIVSNVDVSQKPAESSVIPLPTPKISPNLKEELIALWKKFPVKPSEKDFGANLLTILNGIPEKPHFSRIFHAVSSVFPIQNFLRHATPEQKVFTLIVLTDRFLSLLTEIQFEGRNTLLKTISRFCSDVSEGYSFFQHEGEPIEIQYYERVEGSNSSSRVIKEMHGFVVINKKTGNVFRMGRAMT
ncbi:hypothetical protein HYY75_04895 [bacterium]|nr:hypothetical protein [bacterium]